MSYPPERWREGFCRRMPLRSLVDPLQGDLVGPRHLWPSEARLSERLGPLAPIAGPLLRAVGRTEFAPVHDLALGKTI